MIKSTTSPIQPYCSTTSAENLAIMKPIQWLLQFNKRRTANRLKRKDIHVLHMCVWLSAVDGMTYMCAVCVWLPAIDGFRDKLPSTANHSTVSFPVPSQGQDGWSINP